MDARNGDESRRIIRPLHRAHEERQRMVVSLIQETDEPLYSTELRTSSDASRSRSNRSLIGTSGKSATRQPAE